MHANEVEVMPAMYRRKIGLMHIESYCKFQALCPKQNKPGQEAGPLLQFCTIIRLDNASFFYQLLHSNSKLSMLHVQILDLNG